ncbi:hypothetical protein OROMI_014861 [Orobanche minor]
MASASEILTEKNDLLNHTSTDGHPTSADPTTTETQTTATSENPIQNSTSSPSGTTHDTIQTIAKQISATILKYSTVEGAFTGPAVDPATSASVNPSSIKVNAPGCGSADGSAPTVEEGVSPRSLLFQKDPASRLPQNTGGTKSYRDATTAEDNADVRFGTMDFSDLNPTVKFSRDTVSEYYIFALIGKFHTVNRQISS